MDDLWRDLRLALDGLPNKVYCVADALEYAFRSSQFSLTGLGLFISAHLWNHTETPVILVSMLTLVFEQ